MLGILEDKKKMVKKPTEDSRLSTLIDYYLDSKSYRNLSPTSQKEYSLNLKVVRRDLGGVLLRNMSTTQLEAAYDEWIKNGIPRANKLAAILSIVLNKAIGLGIRIVNPYRIWIVYLTHLARLRGSLSKSRLSCLLLTVSGQVTLLG